MPSVPRALLGAVCSLPFLAGCDFDVAKSAGLNAAFIEAVYPLIEDYLSGG